MAHGKEIPEHLKDNDLDVQSAFFLSSFFDLNTTRNSNEAYINSISYFDVIKYAEIVKYKDVNEFVEIIRQLDNFYISESIKEIEKKRKVKK